MENNLHINQLNNRKYILSPAVKSGNDRECTNKDFYQQEDNNTISIGKLGIGMKVLHRRTRTPYTIVHFEKARVAKFKLEKKINSTLDLMYRSSHPYLFRLLNHYETNERVFMIFEAYDGESLDEKIIKGECDLDTSLKYLLEVMIGVQHMHQYKLYNLSVIPENILIGDYCIKLTDYGLKLEGKKQKPKRTNISLKKDNISYIINAYTSPEELNAIINKKPCLLNGKTDSWNCGILLYEMLTNFGSPFKGNNDDEFMKSILNGEIDLEPIKDEFCKKLISQLVRKDPNERIDINDVLKMEEINNIEIQKPLIDFLDNIINPIDERAFVNNNNQNKDTNTKKVKFAESSTKNQQYKKEITNLKSENDSLKQLVEDLRKQVVSSDQKNRASKHIAKLKSMVIDVGSEIVAEDDNIIEKTEKKEENDGPNLGDLLNGDDEDTPQNNSKEKSENKIEELNKSIKHEIIEEEDDDEDEDFSDKEEEYNDENLFVRCEKYKERNNQLKEKLHKISKKNKKLKSNVEEYKKQIEQLNNDKNKNILETLEKINTVPIYEINDLVNVILNSINIFKNTQNDIKTSLDKIISISEEQNEKLKDENKKYLDNKTKLFFDIMNNKITEKEALDEINKPEITNQNENQTDVNNINNNKINIKNEDYKEKYEEIKRKEELLNAKIKSLEENLKSSEELKNVTLKEHQELSIQFEQFVEKAGTAETKIQDLKRFINENVDANKAKEIFNQLNIN